MKRWATVQHQIPHNAIDTFLKILNPVCPDLPKDSRTLLNTPMYIEVSDLDTGKIVYLGLQSEIQKRIKLFSQSSDKEIKLSFNIDGLPLFKSSNTQLWPILALIKKLPMYWTICCGSFLW